jgi:hypothetical protein
MPKTWDNKSPEEIAEAWKPDDGANSWEAAAKQWQSFADMASATLFLDGPEALLADQDSGDVAVEWMTQMRDIARHNERTCRDAMETYRSTNERVVPRDILQANRDARNLVEGVSVPDTEKQDILAKLDETYEWFRARNVSAMNDYAAKLDALVPLKQIPALKVVDKDTDHPRLIIEHGTPGSPPERVT